ncbi:TNNC1 protein, partial [Pseudoatta argentina]
MTVLMTRNTPNDTLNRKPTLVKVGRAQTRLFKCLVAFALRLGYFAAATAHEEIQLSKDQLSHLKMAFDAFDHDKKGSISTNMVNTILGMLGHEVPAQQLAEVIAEIDTWGTGELKFEEFCQLASHFLEEDTDTEAIQQELREAFRMYDKEGNGYITTEVFRDILHELDDALSPEELDMIIEEVDTDGSGTLDYDGEILRDAQVLIRSVFVYAYLTSPAFTLQNSWRS